MEKPVALSHEFSTLPTLVYMLVAIGVVLSALFLYLMRITDRARAENKPIRAYLDPIDFFTELVFAAATGYGGFFAALHFDMGITGIVMVSHGAAYLNRPIYLLIRRYGDALMAKMGVTVSSAGADTTGLDFATKFAIVNRLSDSWQALADYYDVPVADRALWGKGQEPHSLLTWIGHRGRMSELSAALIAIQRQDLAELLKPAKKFE